MIHQQVTWTNFEEHWTKAPKKYMLSRIRCCYSDSGYILFYRAMFSQIEKQPGYIVLSWRAKKKKSRLNARYMIKARYF